MNTIHDFGAKFWKKVTAKSMDYIFCIQFERNANTTNVIPVKAERKTNFTESSKWSVHTIALKSLRVDYNSTQLHHLIGFCRNMRTRIKRSENVFCFDTRDWFLCCDLLAAFFHFTSSFSHPFEQRESIAALHFLLDFNQSHFDLFTQEIV